MSVPFLLVEKEALRPAGSPQLRSGTAARELLHLLYESKRSNKPGYQPFGQGDVGKKCPLARALT